MTARASSSRATPAPWRSAPTRSRARSSPPSASRGLDFEIVRTGSRGLFWLEPMVEVATPQGRIAYGPVRPDDVEAAVRRRLARWRPHALRLGRPEEIPFLEAPDAAHLRALRHRRSALARRLPRPWRLSRPGTRARARRRRRSSRRSPNPGCAAAAARASRPASSGGPPREAQRGAEIHRLQRRRGRFRHLRRPHDHGRRSLRPDRRHDDRRHRGRRDQGLRLFRSEYPHAIAIFGRAIAIARDARLSRRRRSRTRHTPSTSSCASAPAPMSAAKKPRCSKAWKASAARCAPSRRCRRIRACSAQPTVVNNVHLAWPRCRRSWPRAPRPTAISAWAARAARCRSSSPATSSIAACSRRPSA